LLKESPQPEQPLAALAALKPHIKLQTTLLYSLKVLSLLCIWAWFYNLSGWLDVRLIQQLDTPFPWLPTALTIFATTSFNLLSTQVRRHAAGRISQEFYNLYFQELNDHRWALIRTKPITAWQDVSFRHLPAIEQYLLDYQTQRKLMTTIPLFVLLFILPLSWLAALILLFTLPLIPLFMWLVGHGTAAVQKKHMVALNKLGAFFSDRIEGVVTVRLLNQQNAQLRLFQQISKEQNKRLAEVFRLAFLSASVLDFFATVSMALVAVYIGFSLLGEIPFGFWGASPSLHAGLFILLIAPAFFAELKKLGKLYHVKAEATASASMWQHTLTWQPELQVHNQRTDLTAIDINDAIIKGFDNVTLLTIKHLQLTANDRIYLTGTSGAGKTVLLDAFAGLRAIQSPKMTLNHEQVTTLHALRDHVFYLGQRAVFFEGSIADNIGLQKFGTADIEMAIERVGMASWLKHQPQGIKTALQEKTPLSGGQRQRLALARLVLFDLPLVLLDEPLAHLSADEQADLLPLLFELTVNKVSIWVSHHPLPREQFSQIWNIDNRQLIQVTHGK